MINWSLIEHFEGRRELVGSVPNPDRSKSGVTIATGFDLGCRNETDLIRLKLPPALITRFKPYLGPQRHDAAGELADRPLVISEGEAKQIDRAVRKDMLLRLHDRWADATETLFSDLPNGIQTVIASVAFQYGDLSRKARNSGVTAPRGTGRVPSKNFSTLGMDTRAAERLRRSTSGACCRA